MDEGFAVLPGVGGQKELDVNAVDHQNWNSAPLPAPPAFTAPHPVNPVLSPGRIAVSACVLALALITGFPSPLISSPPEGRPLTRIAFGSCNRVDHEQPIWEAVVRSRPDLWIWLGDIVYADTEDMEVMRRKYEGQKQRPEYQLLLRSCPVIGVWDDHDYGRNNAGKDYPKKAESQQILLDFLDEPEDSPRRRREGVYASYTWGPPGRRVKAILLDTRYHRDPPGGEGDVLGPGQWSWLEEELRNSDAQVHLIGSSIQVLAEEHPYEKWANFPLSRERLLQLIAITRAKGVIFLSGDRHIAEISRMDHPAVDYPLHDLTSSGMTHSYDRLQEEPNRHRRQTFFNQLNFGLVELDWLPDKVAVRLQVRDRQGSVVRQQLIEWER